MNSGALGQKRRTSSNSLISLLQPFKIMWLDPEETERLPFPAQHSG